MLARRTSQANQAENGWRLKTRPPHQQAFLVNPVPAESVRAWGLIRSTEPNAGSLPAGSLSNPGRPRWRAVRVLISRLFSKINRPPVPERQPPVCRTSQRGHESVPRRVPQCRPPSELAFLILYALNIAWVSSIKTGRDRSCPINLQRIASRRTCRKSQASPRRAPNRLPAILP